MFKEDSANGGHSNENINNIISSDINNIKLKIEQMDSQSPKQDPVNIGNFNDNFDNKTAHF